MHLMQRGNAVAAKKEGWGGDGSPILTIMHKSSSFDPKLSINAGSLNGLLLLITIIWGHYVCRRKSIRCKGRSYCLDRNEIPCGFSRCDFSFGEANPTGG